MSSQSETYQLSQIQLTQQVLEEIQETNKLLKNLIITLSANGDLLSNIKEHVDHLAWTKTFDVES